jgi:hypothetical protein
VTEHAKTKKTPKNTMEEGGNSRFFHLYLEHLDLHNKIEMRGCCGGA